MIILYNQNNMYTGDKFKSRIYKNTIEDVLKEIGISSIPLWVEPFGGSFGMYRLMTKFVDIPINNCVYNDLDKEVYDKYSIGDINHNKGWESIIDTYDTINTLFYIDPPYYGTEHYYNEYFDEHIELRNKLMNIKGNFVVSYNDCEMIRNLYSNDKFKIMKVISDSYIHKKEIFIYNNI